MVFHVGKFEIYLFIPWESLLLLIGGFNPLEKYARQIGSFLQVGVKRKKYLKPPRSITLRKSNIAMENPPFVNEFPIGKGEFPASYVRLPEW